MNPSRLRMPMAAVGVLALVVGLIADLPGWWRWGSVGLFAVGLALYVRIGTPRGTPVDLTSPVQGRWVAFNSPGEKVPSHGVHAWSQTYAVDLVYDPGDGSRPVTAWWPLARRPEEFPGFGRPVFAPMPGVVVRALGGMRDHWSRTSSPALLYFLVEGVRELLGPPGVFGNHVVIKTDEGAYVLLAHLRRRSIRVAPGDRVRRGTVVAACGNSGNSTEPHLHMQAMDRPNVWVAAGRPLLLDGSALPRNGEVLSR
jgi:hypothetical protein